MAVVIEIDWVCILIYIGIRFVDQVWCPCTQVFLFSELLIVEICDPIGVHRRLEPREAIVVQVPTWK
jgi:hypothetical protein